MTSQNEPHFPSPAPVVALPSADVQAPQVGEGIQVTYTFPIRQPEEDFNDFQVGVRASVLKRCRGRLGTIAAQGFPPAEILLGISTLSAGAALSAVISGVQLGSGLGFIFFVVLPMVAVGSGVAYWMLRRSILREAQHLAEDILNELPDPNRSVPVRSR